MKKETLKESGKFILDISKIIIAVAVITPFVKGGNLDIFTLISALSIAAIGVYTINKGAKDE